MNKTILLLLFGFVLFIPACSGFDDTASPLAATKTPWIITPDHPLPPTRTPFLPQGATFTPTRLISTNTGIPTSTAKIATPVIHTATSLPTSFPTIVPGALTIGLASNVPAGLRNAIKLPQGWRISNSPVSTDIQLGLSAAEEPADCEWYYALAAPFPTLIDEVSLDELKNAWSGVPSAIFLNKPILVSSDTKAVFEMLWGTGKSIQVVDRQDLLSAAWERSPSFVILPFDELEPRWKVIRIDGQSLLDSNLDRNRYLLKGSFRFSGKQEALIKVHQLKMSGSPIIPAANWDGKRMTTLIMTGVTALVRATGAKMDTLGAKYPGKDIRHWLISAHLTHISNEVPFATNCPKANPFQETLIFCSRPEYIELLDDIGTDIVELTGNHMMDWGAEAFRYTLDLYKKRKWVYYGAGLNVEEARKAALVEHNGNRLAFIGCNPVGPASNWAKGNSPGSANCDYPWLRSELMRLQKAGYLPIMTFQYQEIYSLKPTPAQQRDFRAMAEAGAVIVSGSQSHYPQAIDFYADHFIHYGLGNLFFDQMDEPVAGTRREFLDRHVFYNNRHISTELLTAMLEDYARPRPMTLSERQTFLQDIFRASGW